MEGIINSFISLVVGRVRKDIWNIDKQWLSFE